MNATDIDKVALSVFHIGIFVVGFPGNLLVLVAFAFSKEFRSRPSNTCLLFLTIGDFLTTLFAPPYFTSGLMTKHFDRSDPGFYLRLCKVTIFAITITGITRIFSFTAMSVERFFAIVYPYIYTKHCTRKKVYIAGALIWVHSALSTLPAVLVDGWLEYNASSESICKFTSKPESIVYTAPMVLFNFTVPTVTVILMNVRVFWIARDRLRKVLKEKEQFCRLCAQGDGNSAVDVVTDGIVKKEPNAITGAKEVEQAFAYDLANSTLPPLDRIDEGDESPEKKNEIAIILGKAEIRVTHAAVENTAIGTLEEDLEVVPERRFSSNSRNQRSPSLSWFRRKSSLLRKYFQQGKCKHGNAYRNVREMKILLSTLVLAFAFTLTWAPYVLTKLIITVWKETNSPRLQMFASAGTVINCGLNPVIILLTRKEVRDILRRSIARRRGSVLPNV